MTAAGLPAKGLVVKASTCSKGTVIIGAGARVSNRTARTLKSTRRKRTDGPRSDHTRATLRTDLPRSSNFFWCGQPPHSSQIAESLRRAGGRARPRRCLRQRDFATPQSIVGCLVCHAKTHALAANSGFLLPKLAGFAVQAQRRAAPCLSKICKVRCTTSQGETPLPLHLQQRADTDTPCLRCRCNSFQCASRLQANK
jgi:hypothetical protein